MLGRLSAPERAAYQDKDRQVLRIAASDVAAVAGYHEWVDVRELFLERLLYQDLEHVFRMDAANVGVEVEDKRQRSERLLAKTGDRELRKVRSRAADGTAVATVQDAQALREKARSLLKEAQAKKKISKAEAMEIEHDLRYDINTQFGTRNEHDAIMVYERRSGTEVICSNERILVWPFPGDREGTGVPDGALSPPRELSKGWTKRESAAPAVIEGAKSKAQDVALTADQTSAANDPSFAAAATQCLAELPALAALGFAKGLLTSVPGSTNASGTDQENRQGAAESDQRHADGPGRLQDGEQAKPGSQETDNIGDGAGNSEMGAGNGKRPGSGDGEAGKCMEEASNGKGEGISSGGVDVVPSGRGGLKSSAVVGRVHAGVECEASSGVDAVGNGVAAEGARPPTLPGGSATRRGETRLLAPGVPWPEWRELAPVALSDLKEGAVLEVKLAEGSEPRPALSDMPATILTPSVVPAADGATASAAGKGWAGQHGMWFPAILTARQRAVVEVAAEELGLRHDTIKGESGDLRIVVWEPLTAPSRPMPDITPLSRPLTSSSAAAAAATAVAETNVAGTTIRDPFCPPPPAPAKIVRGVDVDATSDGAGHDLAGGATDTSAASKLHRGRRGGGGRRRSMAAAGIDTGHLDATWGAAATRPRKSARKSIVSREESGSLPPAQTAATAAAAVAVVAGENTDASASPCDLSPTAIGDPVQPTAAKGTSSGSGGRSSGDGHGGKTRVTGVDEFGGDAVYAWGEGPAAASQAAEAEGGLSEGPEPSVWSRAPHDVIDVTAAADAGLPSPRDPKADDQDEGQVGEGGAGGVEEEGGGLRTGTSATALSDGRNRGKGTTVETLRQRRKKACFLVVGAVDGVAEEVTYAPEDGDAWETRRVVVEVKNRMSKARHPPPLYDQIQLVTYMLMIGASVGDLVQFVKTNAGRRNSRKVTTAKARGLDQDNIGQTAKEEDVVVSRVELDCRAYHHRKHWQESVLPRLYEFARMVYRFRGDDMLRFRYLLASPDEQRHMLVECCPYLDAAIPRPVVHPPPRLPPPSPPPPETPPTSPDIVVVDEESPAPTNFQEDVAKETTSADVGAVPCASTDPAVVGAVDVTEIIDEVGGGTGGGGRCGSVRPDRVRGGCCEPTSARRPSPAHIECSGERGAVKVLARKTKQDERCFEPSGLAVTSEVEAAAAVSHLRKKSKRDDDVAIGRVPFAKAQNVQ